MHCGPLAKRCCRHGRVHVASPIWIRQWTSPWERSSVSMAGVLARSGCAKVSDVFANIAIQNGARLEPVRHGPVGSTDRDWCHLHADEQQPWVVLGWCEESWNGLRPPPLTSQRYWHELTATEQAAATHGLGCTPGTWDAAVNAVTSSADARGRRGDRKGFAVATAAASTAATRIHQGTYLGRLRGLDRLRDGSMAHALQTAVLHVANASVRSAGAALVGAIVHVAAVVALRVGVCLPLTEEAQKIATVFQSERAVGLVAVDNVENLVYLDDSDSMNGAHFFEARKAFDRITQDLSSAPTRVVKFGSFPTVLTSRSEPCGGAEAAQSAVAKWDGSSGGTYMWKMIEDDVLEQYSPGSGRLRVFIITDGMDELSPLAYRGLKGMDVMVKSLRDARFDLEFYIIVVGSMAYNRGVDRYRDLAGSTGGAFLGIGHWFDERDDASRKFLAALGQSSSAADDAGSGREQRRLIHFKKIGSRGA